MTSRAWLSAAVGVAALAAGAQAQTPLPIIDMHLHAHPPEEFLQHRLAAPTECALPTVLPPLDVTASATDDLATAYFKQRLVGCTHPLTAAKTEAELIQSTLAILERRNITAVASSAIANVRKWKATAPKRIVVGLDPGDPRSLDVAALREIIASREVKVLGELGAQYFGLSPSDPSLEPIYALAEEFDVPIGIHVGLSAPGIPVVTLKTFRAEASRPLDLERVLMKHPRLRLYMMHAGWPMIDETLHLMWSFPQVYVDIAVLDWILPQREFHAYLHRLVDAGLGQRIMFGSDQMVWPRAIELAIDNVNAAAFLSPRQKRDIFYNNAVRFLRLSERPAQ